MISSFFEKSKPINSILLTFLLIAVFFGVRFSAIFSEFEALSFAKQVGVLLVAIFPIFVIDFIVSKNSLTQKNSYAILVFSLCFLMFPEALLNSKLLFANLFVIFALRRLISMHSKLSIKKKLFDAAFWIALATLCHFWAILFFSIIFIALIFHSQNDFRNWLVPFFGVITVALITVSYNILVHDVFYNQTVLNTSYSLNPDSISNVRIIVNTVFLLLVLFWASMFYFKTVSKATHHQKPSYIIIGFALIVAIVIAVISPNKTGSEFVFAFMPFAIITTTYLEKISNKWFKELLLLPFIIVPILFLIST